MPTFASFTRLLRGPAPSLPPLLDRSAEWWAQRGPRFRFIVGWSAATLPVLLGLVLGSRSPWGETRTIVVAARDLHPAEAVPADGIEVQRWPAAVVPDDAVLHPDDVIGAPMALGAVAGTPLTHRHVSASGLAGLLAPGRVAHPVPLPEGVSLHPGQHVDVLGNDPQAGGVRLASNATVLDVVGRLVWLDLDRYESPGVAAASSWGQVTLVLLGT